MLNFRKYGFKIFACALVAVMALICAPRLGSFKSISAYSGDNVAISNGSFVNTNSSDFPKTPSNWSVVSGSYENTSIKAGVISTNVDDFVNNSEDYGLSVNPHTRLSNDDESILMINAGSKTVRYGYKSESFPFEQNSFYVISINMRTFDSSVGSIYLNVGNEVKSSFVAKNTSGNWGWFRFFVETNELNSASMSIEVWLGGKSDVLSNGVVFFDNISASRYTETDFYYEKENVVYDDSSSKYVDLTGDQDVTSSKITNADFEADEITWQALKNENTEEEDNGSVKNYTKSGVTVIGKNYLASETGIEVDPLTNNSKNNTKALFINNTQAAGFGYKSNKFVIERFSFYRLGVYVKTSQMEEGGASIRLVPTNDDYSTFEFTNVVTNTTTNSITNDWKYYAFYIAGSYLTDIEAELQLWVGNENSKAQGYAFFDDVDMFKIDYSTYSAAADSTEVKLASYIESKTEANIKNAYFNLVNTSNKSLPYTPAEWTKENDEAKGVSGIIVANKEHFEANKSNYGYITFEDIGYTPLQSDKSESATNNLLMIYNSEADYQSYTSSIYSLAGGEDKYYKVSVDVKTLIASGNAYIDVVAGEGGLFASYEVLSNEDWTTYTTYIKVGQFSQNISFVLGLGKEDSKVAGYALFDNVMVVESDADAFAAAKEDDDLNTNVVDFANDRFNIFSQSNKTMIGGDYVDIGTLANYSFEASSNGEACTYGAIKVDGNNVVYVNTTIDGKYTLTSKIVDTLTSGLYYKVTFVVKTENLAQEEINKTTKLVDEEEVVVPFGASFGITENETVFEGIDTKGEKATYSIYLSGEKITSVTPFMSLGYADGLTSGTLYVYSIAIEEVETEDYQSVSDTFFSEDEEVEKDPNILVLSQVEEDEEIDEEEPGTEEVSDTFDWLIIPSLITGLAILVALIGILVRKAKHSPKGGKGGKGKFKVSYDRKKTLHPQVAHRQAEEARKVKLAEIEEKMRLVEQEIKKQEEEYAIKREAQKQQKAQAKAEKEFKAYAKKRAKLEKDKEKLEAEKEQTNSEEFLQKTEEKIIADYEKQAILDAQADEPEAETQTVESEAEVKENVEVEVESEEQTSNETDDDDDKK